MSLVYLDYNATAPIRPEAVEAVAQALAIGANPSSVHGRGRSARALVEQARGTIAQAFGASPEAVTFTSGGTEADALAIESARAAGFAPVILGAIEHDAVVETAAASGTEIHPLPVDRDGVYDLARLADLLAAHADDRPFVAMMLANNETGVIQPVAEAAALVREAGGWLHVDAVQAAGKIAVDFDALGADTLALSAHKLGGPQGSGALIAGPRARLTRRLHGGGQERGRRGGTENLSGIAGFAAAVEASMRELTSAPAWADGRDGAAARLKAEGATVIGEGAPRLSNTLCVAVPDWASELQVMALDLEGVMVSSGAACSSGKVRASRVVDAMGHADLAGGTLRASSGWASAPSDWDRFAEAWTQAYARHLARRPAA
jgi:cysteine desulfurase